ncbi:hypothetical protein [uncultured Granulicatella sp.]|uniref:hypothetical protein n=1 Tax=uncultured Granulicatella sp. TaxID=316089 RepID=UPI0028D42EA6|nr:hypothetical protein [uncultured Granulicatella sp.]
MKEKQSLTLKQKTLVAIVFLVSALATSEMAHLYIEKNGEYEYSIFRWILVHQWSIVPAVGSVWLLNWKKIEFIKQNFFVKVLLNWILILVMTYILEIISLFVILIFVH